MTAESASDGSRLFLHRFVSQALACVDLFSSSRLNVGYFVSILCFLVSCKPDAILIRRAQSKRIDREALPVHVSPFASCAC